MHNSSHLQRTAKGLRLKVFDSLLTPAFPTLAHPTFNPFVFYRFQEHRGGGARTYHLLRSEERAGGTSKKPSWVAYPFDFKGWVTLRFREAGTGGSCPPRFPPFSIFLFPFSLQSSGAWVRREPWDVAHPLHASCSLIADCCSQLMRSGAEEAAAPLGLPDFWLVDPPPTAYAVG